MASQKDKIQKHLQSLYIGIERENDKKEILLECIKAFKPGTEEYTRLSNQIELITGNIGMISAVIEQEKRRLEELTTDD